MKIEDPVVLKIRGTYPIVVSRRRLAQTMCDVGVTPDDPKRDRLSIPPTTKADAFGEHLLHNPDVLAAFCAAGDATGEIPYRGRRMSVQERSNAIQGAKKYERRRKLFRLIGLK